MKSQEKPVELSIVVVNWNTREMTRECLQSVYDNLEGVSAEVILVDNASEDGSADMVAQDFPQAVLIRNDDNRGFAAANNQGFEIAKGEFVLLLNSDTLVHGTVLADSIAYLRDTPAAGAMGCRVLNTDGTVQLTCSQYPTLFNTLLSVTGLWKLKWPKFFGRYHMTDWQRDTERTVDVISGCYLIVRRSVMDEVGVLDEDFFFFGEETDWCKRIRDAGWELRFAPVGEITHHGSVSAKKLNHKRDMMLANAKVRLHLKHGGWLAAATCWALLLVFNSSRAVFWTLLGAIKRTDAAKARASHFRKIVASFSDVWVS